jgi:hypothetical protein
VGAPDTIDFIYGRRGVFVRRGMSADSCVAGADIVAFAAPTPSVFATFAVGDQAQHKALTRDGALPFYIATDEVRTRFALPHCYTKRP